MADSQNNAGRIFSVYCPWCKQVTDKISFDLLREAGKVRVECPICGGSITELEYNDGSVTVRHPSY